MDHGGTAYTWWFMNTYLILLSVRLELWRIIIIIVVMTIVVTGAQDRYAEIRDLPPIDIQSQDWFLINSEEQNGFTILEFSRNFTSCDPQDLDITVSCSQEYACL